MMSGPASLSTAQLLWLRTDGPVVMETVVAQHQHGSWSPSSGASPRPVRPTLFLLVPGRTGYWSEVWFGQPSGDGYKAVW